MNDKVVAYLQFCIGFVQKTLGIYYSALVCAVADFAGLVKRTKGKCDNFAINSSYFCFCGSSFAVFINNSLDSTCEC